jgi:hypothetical protein
MQVFVRDHDAMIAAPVQCDVDGIPKRSHHANVPSMRQACKDTRDVKTALASGVAPPRDYVAVA